MTATILVVDDLEQNVKLLEAKLFSEYYTVFSANNGIAALTVIKEHKIDLVLLDVMMPEMDGFEACKEIKSNPETTHIPVVMVTALSDITDRIKGLESGADEFLTKPIHDTALFARVKSLTRMKTVVDELKLRNKTSAALGGNIIAPRDIFTDYKILILDDDVVQAKNLKIQLINITEQIYSFASSKEIEQNYDLLPDLVIISCQMDIEDPLRIGVMLRSKPNFKNASLMLLAEEENMPLVIKGMEIGINDYCIYPVDTSELQARVKTLLRKKQYQDDLRTGLEESLNLSTKDGLTGLFNRRYFDIHITQMIKKSIRSNQKMCMIMLDIDNFKEVNDTYGHPAGDAILKTLSNILKSSFRVTDLISRYGGEEFVVLINNIDLDTGIKIAEKARKTIEKTDLFIPGHEDKLQKTTSIGIAEYHQNETIENFIFRVDTSLYEAKKAGRNKVMAKRYYINSTTPTQ